MIRVASKKLDLDSLHRFILEYHIQSYERLSLHKIPIKTGKYTLSVTDTLNKNINGMWEECSVALWRRVKNVLSTLIKPRDRLP